MGTRSCRDNSTDALHFDTFKPRSCLWKLKKKHHFQWKCAFLWNSLLVDMILCSKRDFCLFPLVLKSQKCTQYLPHLYVSYVALLPSQQHLLHSLFSRESWEHLLSGAWYHIKWKLTSSCRYHDLVISDFKRKIDL